MSLRMIHAKIWSDKATEMEKAQWFAAIDCAQPGGVRYASCRLPDGITYVILLDLDNDERNPLEAVPGFTEFQENLKNFLTAPPEVQQLTPVGSYRLF